MADDSEQTLCLQELLHALEVDVAQSAGHEGRQEACGVARQIRFLSEQQEDGLCAYPEDGDRNVKERQHPEGARPFSAKLPPRDVVRGSTAAQGEAAVPPARAARDLAGVEQAHALPRLRHPERAGAARHAAADDRHVDRSRRPVGRRRKERARLFKPVRARLDVDDPSPAASPSCRDRRPRRPHRRARALPARSPRPRRPGPSGG